MHSGKAFISRAHVVSSARKSFAAIFIGLFSQITHAQFSVDSTLVEFGPVEVGSSGLAQTFTLTNVGSGDTRANLDAAAAAYCGSPPAAGCLDRNADDAGSFRASMDCSLFVPPAQSCKVKVEFVPLAARPLQAVLHLGMDITGREVAVTLRGTGLRRGTLVQRLGYQKSLLVGGAIYFIGYVARDMSQVPQGRIRLRAKEIRNLNTSRASGPIRFQAVVSASKDADFSLPYFVVGSADLDALPPGGFHADVDVRTDYHPPPPGDYYLYFVAAEYEGSPCEHEGYCIDESVVFSDFSHYDGRSIVELSQLSPLISEAVEFHHAEFDHYFITVEPGEMALLDLGQIPGWKRTGESFPVWPGNIGETAMCRFFSASFAPKSSHFYTPYGPECEALRQSSVWVNEFTSFFVVGVSAYAESFHCRSGVPIYRLYNNGMGGAPNHRFTISVETRAAMVEQGWMPEGATSRGIAACSAPG